MNKIFVFISCLLLCILPAGGINASVPQEPGKPFVCNLSSLAEKEKLVYKAKFLGISIGTFIIINNGKMMLNGQEAYCFELKVRTLPFFSILFKTKARYVSYLDAQEFVVLRHEEYVKGGTLLESAVDFDYKNFTATNKNFINHQENTVKIPDKILDVLSGSFYLRMMPLALGDKVDLNIYADQRIYNYTGRLSSKIKVHVPHHGKQDAYPFKPYLFLDGKQVIKISAEVFFSTTTPRKALRATLKTLLGNVNVILVEGYESL
ncbi:MAG: DUF3108 domain-containing protein [Candidatus Omnitrophota bacterium]